ncbi:MAG: outer membrane protein assembly factor [Gammaproteobacteria bacterium]|nr:outer membrane protein assembly factor [Gammaproteobacteria bacterium]
MIEIQGASGKLLDNLRTSLPLTGEPCDAPRWRIERLFKRSPDALDQAARALGYYRIKTEPRLKFEKGCWQARFTVDPGAPIVLRQVSIRLDGDAKQDPEFQKLVHDSAIRVGAQLHHGEYEKLKDQLETLAAERGYFDGKFTRKLIEVDPGNNRATVTLHYDSGRRYRIGLLELQQQTYNPELLERFLKTRSGDPYDATALNALHRALADSGYFEQVVVRQDFENAADGVIDIRVQLQPRKRTAYTIGIGAATDTGPRIKASHEKRRVNRNGHRVLSKLMLSQVDSSLGVEYIVPTKRPHIDQISFHAGYQRLDTDTAESTIGKIGLTTIGQRSGWVETMFLDWVVEDSTIGDETVSSQLLVPGISWSKTVADNLLRPRNGHRLSLSVRGAEKTLLSDSSFIQIMAAAKWIQPLNQGRLLLRAEGGVSFAREFSELPASYRFFAGGDRSVRGYQFDSLGPRDSDGDVVGGRHRLTASIEYEHPIVENWSAALFVDAGNAFDDWNPKLKYAAGAGVRWQSPIGPIRVDLAVPTDNEEDDFRLHFSMGADL